MNLSKNAIIGILIVAVLIIGGLYVWSTPATPTTGTPTTTGTTPTTGGTPQPGIGQTAVPTVVTNTGAEVSISTAFVTGKLIQTAHQRPTGMTTAPRTRSVIKQPRNQSGLDLLSSLQRATLPDSPLTRSTISA